MKCDHVPTDTFDDRALSLVSLEQGRVDTYSAVTWDFREGVVGSVNVTKSATQLSSCQRELCGSSIIHKAAVILFLVLAQSGAPSAESGWWDIISTICILWRLSHQCTLNVVHRVCRKSKSRSGGKWGVEGRWRERERERDRQTDRQTDRTRKIYFTRIVV